MDETPFTNVIKIATSSIKAGLINIFFKLILPRFKA